MAKDPRAYASFLAHGMVRRHHGPTKPHPTSKRKTLKRDWSVSLGNGFPWYGVYPAKYTFDVNAPPNCTNDFVVFSLSGSAVTGSSRANVPGTFSGDPAVGQTVSITITPADSSPVTLTLTAGTTNSGTTFAVSGTNNAITDAASLAAVIDRNLSSFALDEIAAVAFSDTVTVYALTAGTGVTLTVSNDLNNFSWGSVTPGVNGSQANLVGLNNLYAGSASPFCAGYTYPTFTFSYAAGVARIDSSPVLSLDGQQIAFVEDDDKDGLGAILHVLTLGTGTEYGICTNSGTVAPTCATAAVIPGSTPGSNATDYMLPLDMIATLGKANSATRDSSSSPFVDYSADVLYVGDDIGNLFSVSPVFDGGTPTLRSGFPVAVDYPSPLSSPIVDVGNTGDIFIEDSAEQRLYRVTSGGVVEGYTTVGFNGLVGYDNSPMVDSTNAVGYVVSACNAVNGNSPVVVQFSTTGTGSPAALAVADLSAPSCPTGLPMYSPTPDNDYFTKGILSNTPGNNGELLVAYYGNPGNLAQIQFASGIMNTTAEYTHPGSAGAYYFTPLTEFYGDDQTYVMGTVTQSENTVTVTTTASPIVSNQVVVISGVTAGTGGCSSAAANAINGEHTVTVTSPTTFGFTSAVNATIGGASGSCNLTNALVTGPTQDYLFFGSTQPGVFTFDLPLTSSIQGPAATNTTSVGVYTSGMIIDNDSSAGQASSLYLETENPSSVGCGAPGCAVKLTQAGLN
jgi:hypothetical protein